MQRGRPLTCNLPHKLGRTRELRPLITAGTRTLIQVLLLTNGLSRSRSAARPHQGQEVTRARLKAAPPAPALLSSAGEELIS